MVATAVFVVAMVCCFIRQAESSCSYLRKLLQEPDALIQTLQPMRSHKISPTAAPTEQPSQHPIRGTTNFCLKSKYVVSPVSKCSVCEANIFLRGEFARLLADPSVVRSNIFGAALRLAFHDAAEIAITTADMLGPDGCLSNSTNNNGLREISTSLVYTVIEPLYQQVCDKISRADFWLLFAKYVIEAAATVPIQLPFYYGRLDNTECSLPEGERLPDASGGIDEITRVFVTQMGLTLEDAVVLIGGGHSIGHVHPDTSGYGFTDGRENGVAATPPGAFPPRNATPPLANKDMLNAWDDTPDRLDNHYYHFMAQLPWFSIPTVPVAGNPVLTQWEDRDLPQIMLNTDMALAFPINTSIAKNQLCLPQGAPRPGAPAVASQCLVLPPVDAPYTVLPDTQYLTLYYASHNADFIRDFGVAFTKMTTLGYALPSDCGFNVTSTKLGALTAIDLAKCKRCRRRNK